MTPRKTYKYHFKRGNRILHTGITDDLERREQEHRRHLKVGLSISPQGEPADADTQAAERPHSTSHLMTDVDFAKLLGKSDALEVAHRIESMRKRIASKKRLDDVEALVENILSDVYFSSKRVYPRIFRDDTGDVYRKSLSDNLKRLGYLPHSAPAPTPA